jgi:hypothetical protein
MRTAYGRWTAGRRAAGTSHHRGEPWSGVDLDRLAEAQFKHAPTYLHINRKTDGTIDDR